MSQLSLTARVERLEAVLTAVAALVDDVGLADHFEAQLMRNVHAVARAAAWHCGVTAHDVLGRSQTKRHKRARLATIWVARRVLELSSPQLGRRLGRDHSTIILSEQRADAMRATDPAFKRLTDRLAEDFRKEEPNDGHR